MNTRPTRKLIEVANNSLHCLWHGVYTANAAALESAIAAAEHALAEEDEAFRLADELAQSVFLGRCCNHRGVCDPDEIKEKARAYRKARRLEE